MNRRLFILGMLSFLGLSFTMSHNKNEKINIWQDTEVGKVVELTPYLAQGQSNIAVVVCPGGSYFWHDMEAEGKVVGEWLQQHGISGFVLRYRTAGFGAYFTH